MSILLFESQAFVPKDRAVFRKLDLTALSLVVKLIANRTLTSQHIDIVAPFVSIKRKH